MALSQSISVMSRRLPAVIAGGRVVLGAGLMVVPGVAGRTYLGRAAHRSDLRFMNRIFGGRDVALGIALAMAGRADPKLERRILLLGVACDGWDAVSALTAGADMPRWGRALVALTGTTWAALGIVAAGAAPRTGVSASS
ncbi:hypothetical protein IU500_21330 [Nocardia terpenica]|uniref:hypothetical protein n=1 Tax=Nocardia terpenica TaxID=455432 RepID=UPI00189393B6|nr:hypothetical protein [Nocardia terpenica]MBF6064247.1 hypothetical protein [Nocardia terpenica]MBF6106580.1 hypothetical protein [Nocardia terpenica]MBF6113865.1 hypothetical protein [Nocardia terpenica]MBF6120511.1 hypothetical protein [Nocardia terpenica]MBF6154832.1 hypothetical protein [Nocardia terpenica]